MVNPDTNRLERWFFTPYEGHEGFADDLAELDRDELHIDDVDYLIEVGVFSA